MHLSLSRTLPPSPALISPNTLALAAMFGLGLDDAQQITLYQNVPISITPGHIILIIGPSGSGKSTLLNDIASHLPHALHLTNFPLESDRALIDTFNLPLDQTLEHLARAGLSDAFVLLRRPSELSDGQRFRYRLARATASTPLTPGRPNVIIADEFAATLDRLTGKILAHQLRKTITRTNQTALLATTHDDLIDDLQPDVLIHKHLGEKTTVIHRTSREIGSTTPSACPT